MQVALEFIYSIYIQLKKLRIRNAMRFSKGHIGRNIEDPGFQPKVYLFIYLFIYSGIYIYYI